MSTTLPIEANTRGSLVPHGRDVKQAFAQFVTGVVVVVATTTAGERAVAKVQAFSSVSLDPALVLWSLEKTSDACSVFSRAFRFVAHVLAHEQRALMQDEGAICQSSCSDTPEASKQAAQGDAFDGCSAWFECAPIAYFDGGDHGCYMAEIRDFAFNDTRPLIAYAGAYRFPGIHPDVHSVAGR